jgi:GT2 family glycosyltransferase
MYCEDIDYSRRLHSHGYKTLCFTTSKVIHDIDDRQQLRPIKKFRKYKIYLTSVGQYIKKYFGVTVLLIWIFLLPISFAKAVYPERNE